jgi:hypothetical protein
MPEMLEKITRVTVHVLVLASLFLLLFSPFFESQTEQIGLVCADGVKRQLPEAYSDLLSTEERRERTAKCWGYNKFDFADLIDQKLNNRLDKGFTTENIQKNVDWHTGKMDATCSLSNVHFMIQALNYKINNEGLPWHSPERIMQPTSPMGGADMSDTKKGDSYDNWVADAAATKTDACLTPDQNAIIAAVNIYFDHIITKYESIANAEDTPKLKTELETIANTDVSEPFFGVLNAATLKPDNLLGNIADILSDAAARLQTNASSIMLRSRRNNNDIMYYEYGLLGSDNCGLKRTLVNDDAKCKSIAQKEGVEYRTIDSEYSPKGCHAVYDDGDAKPSHIFFNSRESGGVSDINNNEAPVCDATEKTTLLTQFAQVASQSPETILEFLAGRGEFPCAAFSKAQCGQCGVAKSNIGDTVYDQLTKTTQCRWLVDPNNEETGVCVPSQMAQLFYKGNDKNFFEAEATIPGECFEKGNEDFTIPGVWHTTDVRSGPLYFENNGTCGHRGGLAYIPSYPSCVIKNVLDSEFPDSAIMLITSIVLYFIITVVSFMKVENETLKTFVEFTFLVTFVFTVATAGVITDTLIKAHPADTANGNDVFAQLFDAIYMLGLIPNGIKYAAAVDFSIAGFKRIGGLTDAFDDFDILNEAILFGTPRAEIVDGRTFGTHNYVGWYHPHNSHVTPVATGAIVVLWVSLVVHIGISYRNRFTANDMAYRPLLS